MPTALRVILRFGNQQADTVPEHLAVIEREPDGYVWWGWWAKSWERVPSADRWASLEEAATAGGFVVGLFDRRRLRYYRAQCVEMRRSPDTVARIASPEPDYTPAYYADKYFPVWFKFTSIVSVSAQQFETSFSSPPLAADQTLYVLAPGESTPGSTRIDSIETSSSAILHISDLHFGDDFGYPAQSGSEPRSSGTLEAQILEYLREDGVDVGVVVASGDLITRGFEKHYRDVSDFFEALLSGLGLDHDHLVVVPGNHDLWIDDAATFTYSHDYRHELGYRDWHDSFFGDSKRPIERLRVFTLPDGQALAFVQVNSARLREKETMEFGYVGRHRYIELLHALSGLEIDLVTSFFVLHHHIVPVPGTEDVRLGRPVSVTVDAGQIIEDLQRFGVQCILHGHQHLPFIGSSGRMSFNQHGDPEGHVHPIAIVGCGSSGVKGDRLSPALRSNVFGLYHPEDGAMKVTFVQCGSGSYVRNLMSTTVPLLTQGADRSGR